MTKDLVNKKKLVFHIELKNKWIQSSFCENNVKRRWTKNSVNIEQIFIYVVNKAKMASGTRSPKCYLTFSESWPTWRRKNICGWIFWDSRLQQHSVRMILLILNINNNIDMFCLYLCSTSKAELLCMLAVADKNGDG